MNEAISPGGRVQDGKLQGIEGHAAVSVRKGHQTHHRLDVHLDVVPTETPLGVLQGSLDNPEQGIFRERLAADDKGPGEERAEHYEGRTLRSSTDEDDRARLGGGQ